MDKRRLHKWHVEVTEYSLPLQSLSQFQQELNNAIMAGFGRERHIVAFAFFSGCKHHFEGPLAASFFA